MMTQNHVLSTLLPLSLIYILDDIRLYSGYPYKHRATTKNKGSQYNLQAKGSVWSMSYHRLTVFSEAKHTWRSKLAQHTCTANSRHPLPFKMIKKHLLFIIINDKCLYNIIWNYSYYIFCQNFPPNLSKMIQNHDSTNS